MLRVRVFSLRMLVLIKVHEDEDQYRALVELTDRGRLKTEILIEKPVPGSLRPPLVLHGLARDRIRVSVVRGR